MLKARRQLLSKHMEGTELIRPDITTSESLTIQGARVLRYITGAEPTLTET
jgi:hypothetical protein